MRFARIRMYRQGLGDCFLLTFPKRFGESHILIDCGVLTGTADAQDRMRKVAQNIFDTTKGKLDALVVTHEHWDHISGFLQAEEIFNKLKISEVWLAWTEDPNDEAAEELRARKAKALNAVTTAVQKLQSSGSAHGMRLMRLLEFHGGLGVEGRKTTAKAMEWVKNRDKAKIRYFKPADGPIRLADVDSFRAYVLGPPLEGKLLRRSNPSKKKSEVYELAGQDTAEIGFLSAVESLEAGAEAKDHPFDDWFQINAGDSSKNFFEEHYWKADHNWRRVEGDWLGVAGRLALQLDSATNNTCLALAFELTKSRRVLLFPGDAQVGNWLSWEGLRWTFKNGRTQQTVTTRDLFARTVLYKVGHHGSHNATLREKGLELMLSDELAAMIPVSRETARKMEWNMPFPSLLRRLQEKTRGRILDRDRGIETTKPERLSAKDWKQFIARTSVEDDWIDYKIEI
jgi:hypothetical protein